MKVISKEDLLILIPLIDDRDSFDLDDFEIILDRFGDDYFVMDGRFQKCGENKEMAEIRKDAQDDTPKKNLVEVVRCGSCKYWREDYRYCVLLGVDYFGNSKVCENDFCSNGERKEIKNESNT